ncbi:hypothetical protein L596_001235 [Steinernema carpocapsae]|nr:hypothetical protein L596_001235 [Steinernema carpocapsae]
MRQAFAEVVADLRSKRSCLLIRTQQLVDELQRYNGRLYSLEHDNRIIVVHLATHLEQLTRRARRCITTNENLFIKWSTEHRRLQIAYDLAFSDVEQTALQRRMERFMRKTRRENLQTFEPTLEKMANLVSEIRTDNIHLEDVYYATIFLIQNE